MPDKLNVLVMGAGAVGCFVGGTLAAAGHQVTLVGRAALMNKIASAGLSIQWPGRSASTVWPETTLSTADLKPDYDFILVTVKSPDTAAAAEQLAALVRAAKQTWLVSLQNGIGNEEQLSATVGAHKVIAGAITIPMAMTETGCIEVTKPKGGLGLARLDQIEPVETLAGALNQAGLTTRIYPDYRAMKWSKLLLNIVNNASSAILNLPPAEIIARPELLDLEIEAIREGVQVMGAQGLRAVRLPGYPVDWLAWLVSAGWLPPPLKRRVLRPFMRRGRGSKMPSLQLDLAAGRTRSEIETLNGAIVRAGKKLGISTPVNQALTEILPGIFTGELAWTEYQHQPAKLLAAVAANQHP